jgi:hypothetical protein
LGIVEDAANSVFHDAAFVHCPRFLIADMPGTVMVPDRSVAGSDRLPHPIPEPGKEALPNDITPEIVPAPLVESDIIKTSNGNFVIAGHGYSKKYYSGFSPTGPAMGPWNGTDHDAGVWMYATGPIAVRIGKAVVYPETPAGAYTNTNESILYAEAPVAVVWDGPHVFAVRVKEL